MKYYVVKSTKNTDGSTISRRDLTPITDMPRSLLQ